MVQGKHVLVGLTGGIAAYKTNEVISSLAKAGAEVRVILTKGAQQFTTPLTVATLSRHGAYTDDAFWHADHARPLHIELGEWADVFLIAPLTAHTLAKLAYGMADNLLTNTVLASTCPVLLAPAMNTDMWEQRAVQRNWALVQSDPRFHISNPSEGILACDRVGQGRMAEPPDLLAQVESLCLTRGDRDLHGKHILISAGGTQEYLDPVRFIGNPATGKMGVALAQAALHRGAAVTVVHGTLESSLRDRLRGIRCIHTPSAHDMQAALNEHFPDADWAIMAAAVADVRPADYSTAKLPKADLPRSLPLAFVPDIAAELGHRKQPHQRLIGFAAQTGDIIPPALNKLKTKKLDAIVANPIDQPDSGFGSDRNQAIFLDSQGNAYPIAHCSKLEMAHHIYNCILKLHDP